MQGKGLTQAMSKDEVVAWLGDKECDVKTLDDTHLYCEPPEEQPLSMDHKELPSLKVLLARTLVSSSLQFSRLLSFLKIFVNSCCSQHTLKTFSIIMNYTNLFIYNNKLLLYKSNKDLKFLEQCSTNSSG